MANRGFFSFLPHGIPRALPPLLLGVLFGLIACSDKTTNPQDTTPPAQVTDLEVTEVTYQSATVTWTAPGDDGAQGQAAEYDLRYGTTPLDQSWETATPVDSLPAPQAAGEREEVVIQGLDSEIRYYFALRTADEVPNWSPQISNVATAITSADTIPPAAVTDLSGTAISQTSLELTWTAPGDDGGVGQAMLYEVRKFSQPFTEETWKDGVEVGGVQAPQLSGTTETLVIGGLTDGKTYYFGLRSQDEGLNWSPLSNVAEVGTLTDMEPPAAITDLAAPLVGRSQVTLTWTAPGDNGLEGQAAAYALRYAEFPITEETWNQAEVVEIVPEPSAPGEQDQVIVSQLTPGTAYYFAVRTGDDRANWSDLSNILQVNTKTLSGVTWSVRADGSGDAPTIQAAIEIAEDGDVVLVGPGTYYENINTRGKAIHLKSEFGPESTTIDGSGLDSSVVVCNSGETNDTIIEGFTITGGRGWSPSWAPYSRLGGGVLLYEAAPRVLNNVVAGNHAIDVSQPEGHSRGGGISFGGVKKDLPPVVVKGNIVEDNWASVNGGGINIGYPCLIQGNIIRRNKTERGDGAGIYLLGNVGQVLIRENWIIENQSGDHGGGIYVADIEHADPPSVEVCGNLILRNTSHTTIATDCSGGGIYLYGGAVVHHNTVAFNDAEALAGIPAAGGLCLQRTVPTTQVEQNIIYANGNGGIVCSSDALGLVRRNIVNANGLVDISVPGEAGLELIENLDLDPLFCDTTATSMGELAAESPALNQFFGVIGAVSVGICHRE